MARRALLLTLLGGALLLPSQAQAASPPMIEATWVEGVNATAADLKAEINRGGLVSTYFFEYLSLATYEANKSAGKDPFTGAIKAPNGGAAVGAGISFSHISGLTPETSYRFRVVATNSLGQTIGPERGLGTQAPTNAFALLDARGWEMVSPADKGGGEVGAPEAIFGGGVFQASADGQALTFSSADSFGSDAQGAPGGSQYIAIHSPTSWRTQDITAPLLAGSYGQRPNGVPFQLFSADLSEGLLSNGQRCRTEVGQCPVANPPLAGSGAPAGYRNYYLRRPDGSFEALIGSADLAQSALGPESFEVRFESATPDLSHLVLSSCAALSTDATEVSAPGGCSGENLYEWSSSQGLRLINLLPGDTQGTPGATLAAPAGAISSNGDRVYFTDTGDLYLREATQTKRVDQAQGGGGEFQAASQDGQVAFFAKSGHLYRYDATSQATTDLTPAGGLDGTLGASADGDRIYFATAEGLFLWHEGTATKIAAGADADNFPPATGTARVSADGQHLLFLSQEELTDYENRGQMEVFLYGPVEVGGPPQLSCISCNPTGERPHGPASIPGAIANGSREGATHLYKPRTLSTNGLRVFFNSADRLSPQDSNSAVDVYEWEAKAEGDCQRQGGCTQLISNGKAANASRFIDASENGADAFFLTDASISSADSGSYDLYDARVGGGFPPPENVIPCEGDACQVLPEAPEDPTPGTLIKGPGNPAPHFSKPLETKQKVKDHGHKKKHGKGKRRHSKGAKR